MAKERVSVLMAVLFRPVVTFPVCLPIYRPDSLYCPYPTSGIPPPPLVGEDLTEP